MNSLNSILLEGNLVGDPEVSRTPKGTSVCKFAIASNRFFKMENEYQKEVSFFGVTTWSRLADVCGEYLKKGRGVRIVGRLKQDRWKDKDGRNQSRIYVIADHIEFKPNFSGKTAEKESQETVEKLGAAVSF